MLPRDVSAMGHAANAQFVIALPTVGRPPIGLFGAGTRSVTEIATQVVDETVAHMERIAGEIAASVEAQSVATREIMGRVRAAGMGQGMVADDVASIHRALAEIETGAANIVASACMLCLEPVGLHAGVSRVLDGVGIA